MIARLAGVALDARGATRTRDAAELAIWARWIAANALAARGIRIAVSEAPPRPRVFEVSTASVTGLLAAIAAVPALVDPATLPRRWRIALRALGVPLLDRPANEAVAAGASVVSIVT